MHAGEDEAFLNDSWTLYFHDPDNDAWDLNSYQILKTVSTAENWVSVDRAFNKLWCGGMFFLMREHIQPMWEDPQNAKGGCFSFKVNKPDVGEYWFQLGCKALGEVLAKKNDISDVICGISISPKRHYCILRVWLSAPSPSDVFALEAPYYSEVIYKSHYGQ